jgi:broad specificity phosphatase PhoE
MLRILLARHGETDWNRERRVLGWSKITLNENGIRQARQLAGWLSAFKIGRVYSSPLPRTFQTAEILCSGLGVEPVADPHFTEANIGDWEGHYWKDLAGDPIRLQYYDNPETARPPGGETSSEVRARAVSGIEAIRRIAPDGTILIVTHADLVRCVLSHYLDIDFKTVRKFWIDHAALSSLSLDGDGATLHFLNLVGLSGL